ncbi:hypothetical protein M5C99_22030 [Acidovorax sp. NCPPB 2350]|nr:hypothetical protein M5C99_22030 [Acidovorax sp. NCPPB 2350]
MKPNVLMEFLQVNSLQQFRKVATEEEICNQDVNITLRSLQHLVKEEQLPSETMQPGILLDLMILKIEGRISMICAVVILTIEK